MTTKAELRYLQSMTTRFIGSRTAQGQCQVVKVTDQGQTPLDPRLDLWNHSPTGFEFGYGGSGPAQTALAILAEVTNHDRLAVALHQQFKWKFVAPCPREGFELSEREILQWVDEEKAKLEPWRWQEQHHEPDHNPEISR
jgi:hypothetical protein